MPSIDIRSVSNEFERRAFLKFPWRIYCNEPNWVPPIYSDRKLKLTPGSKLFFNRGDVEFFVAWKNSEPVGTIAIANDRIANEHLKTKNAFFGFLDFVEDYEVAQALFDRAKNWASQQGLTRLQGPQSFSTSDDPGVLIDGRETPPVLMMGWTLPYYQEFCERYEFSKYRDYLAYRAYARDYTGQDGKIHIPDKLSRAVEATSRHYGFSIRRGDLSKFDQEMETVRQIYNDALLNEQDYVPVIEEDWRQMIEPVKPLLDADMALFAEVEGKTVGFGLGLPDINQALMHCNGLHMPWDYLKLWWYSRKLTGASFKVLVISPEWEGRGLGAMIVFRMVEVMLAKGYQWIDMSLTAEDNPNTNSIALKFGCQIDKRYRLYQLDL